MDITDKILMFLPITHLQLFLYLFELENISKYKCIAFIKVIISGIMS